MTWTPCCPRASSRRSRRARARAASYRCRGAAGMPQCVRSSRCAGRTKALQRYSTTAFGGGRSCPCLLTGAVDGDSTVSLPRRAELHCRSSAPLWISPQAMRKVAVHSAACRAGARLFCWSQRQSEHSQGAHSLAEPSVAKARRASGGCWRAARRRRRSRRRARSCSSWSTGACAWARWPRRAPAPPSPRR